MYASTSRQVGYGKIRENYTSFMMEEDIHVYPI